MILGGLEIPLMKWVGGKLVGAIASHLATAPAHVVVHTAMHATINGVANVSAAAAAGGAMAGASALYDNLEAFGDMAKEVLEKQAEEGHGDIKEIQSMSNEEALAVLRMMVLMAICAGYYESLEHRDGDGDLKTDIYGMEPCLECDCGDLDYSAGKCQTCGHDEDSHSHVTEEEVDDLDAIEWIAREISQECYPLLKNQDGNGVFKSDLSQIDTCTHSSCPCFDFRFDPGEGFISRYCRCGHRFREHQVTGYWNWIIQGLVNDAILELLKS